MGRRDWLIKIRKDNHKTQVGIAEKVNISHQYYSRIEKGLRSPSTGLAKKIAEVLNFEWTRFYE